MEKKLSLYTEVYINESDREKIKKWENETGLDIEDKLQELLDGFLKSLREKQ